MGGILLGFYSKPPRGIKIALGIEMAPLAENRIRLNPENRDPFGNPGADIHLAFSKRDQELWKAGETIVHDIFSRLHGVDIVKEDTPLHWSHHHIGGTRMSAADTDGVVDRDLRVHGTDNLYILSSSVFVTSGVANPTLTIVALAHRLSEHLTAL
jgi:choline dehydrogenase-like flavoprotein